ncbi:MAG: sulfotransferase [Vicinamibacterales bacterium]
MPVCIAGMHRSGTSLMARLLNVSGLYLGTEQDMLPAGPTNPDGHWEHEGIVQVNEELLAEFGGGWDYPPDLTELLVESRIARHVASARRHLNGFGGREPWGWKDPRNSLTLPFWQRLVGPMTVVVCVRNPLEVALSLRMRNGSTMAFGLALWTAYTQAILRATTPATRVVTHYARYHGDPVAEVGRVAARIGLTPTDEQIERVRDAVRPDLRHSRFSFADLLEVRASAVLCRIYRELCAEADAPTQGGLDSPWTAPDAGSDPTEAPGRFDYAVMEQLRERR